MEVGAWMKALLGGMLVMLLLSGAASAQQTVTFMAYMIGSDLESEGYCASSDIVEMAEAEFGESLNVLIQTGGATQWAIEDISGENCQRYEIRDGDMSLEEDLGPMSMMSAEAVGDFIRWGVQSYPADRYAIVFWDHGGGTMMGFGSDEHDPEGQLLLSDIAEGLRLGGVHMDFVGFDACMMGTLETAKALAPHADYMIASEETEPGCGWMYTGFLELLGKEPDAETERVGRRIVEDFMSGCREYEAEGVTMAVIDLSKIDPLYQAVRRCMTQAEEGMQGGERERIVVARSRARTYGEGEYEQVDLADFLRRAEMAGEKDVISALEEAVVYRDGDVTDSCGLAIYHPYAYPEYYEAVSADMRRIGIDEDYFTYFDDFVSALVGGQSTGGGSMRLTQESADSGSNQGPPALAGLTPPDYTGSSWYNAQIAGASAQESASLAQEELVLSEKGDGYVLSLSDAEWEIITDVYLQVFVDDGEGFIDLGMDNVTSFDSDGDLIVDFDYTWVTLDGHFVPFNAETMDLRADGSWYTYGYVEAMLNGGRRIELLVYWDEQNPEGYVAGYRSARMGIGLPARNLLTLEPGDELTFLCDYYTYDGEYDGEYEFGKPLIVGDSQPVVAYEEIAEYTTQICCYLKDAYQREYWTETLELSFQ